MINEKLIMLFFLSLFFFGCLKSPAQAEQENAILIQEKLQFLQNQDCSCFVCTESTGGYLSDFFTVNDLSTGSCYIEPRCSRAFLSTFQEQDSLNFLRTFDIGMGNTYVEYEEANLRSNIGLGIVLRELNERSLPQSYNYLLPQYNGDYLDIKTPYLGKTIFDKKKNIIYRTLEKNTIPIYYINSEHLTKDWLSDFFKKTNIAPTTSFIAVKSSAENVNDLLDFINITCSDATTSTKIQKCNEYQKVECIPSNEDCESIEDDGARAKCESETRWECTSAGCAPGASVTVEIMKYGCKSMLQIDYVINSSNTDYDLALNEVNDVSEANIKKINAFLIEASITEEGQCHAGIVMANAMNFSRTLMNKYGSKPSYLIVKVDEFCRNNYESEIAESLFHDIYYMRMLGIMGIIYYDYLPDTKKVNFDIERPERFLQLNKYYFNFTKNNREPLLFDSDGSNISSICDYMSRRSTLTFEKSQLDLLSIERLDPDLDELKAINSKSVDNWFYVYAIPMLDYGEMSTILPYSSSGAIQLFEEYFGKIITNFMCNVDSSLFSKDIHLEAERCGVSNYLLMAYKENNVVFDCDEWYDMIDNFIVSGDVDIKNVQELDTETMRQLAFAYTMDDPKILKTQSEMRTYCYGTLTINEGLVSPTPCDVINSYYKIRNEYLGGTLNTFNLLSDCYIPHIGLNNP